MTSLRTLALLAIVVLLGTTLVFAQTPTCNASTIQGAYAFRNAMSFIITTAGTAGKKPVNVPLTAALALTGRYDFTPTPGQPSEGTLTVSHQSGNFGGVPIDYPPMTGTYTVNGDCTGKFTRMSAAGQTTTFVFAIADGGNEIEVAIYSADFPLTGSGYLKRM